MDADSQSSVVLLYKKDIAPVKMKKRIIFNNFFLAFEIKKDAIILDFSDFEKLFEEKIMKLDQRRQKILNMKSFSKILNLMFFVEFLYHHKTFEKKSKETERSIFILAIPPAPHLPSQNSILAWNSGVTLEI